MDSESVIQRLSATNLEHRARAYQEAVDYCLSSVEISDDLRGKLAYLCQKYLLDCMFLDASELDSDFQHTSGEAALELSVPFGMLKETDTIGRNQLWSGLASELNQHEKYYPAVATHFLEGYDDKTELAFNMKLWKSDEKLSCYVKDLEEIWRVIF